MTVYEYLTQAYSEDKGGRGELARELVRLAEKDETIKDMRTFVDLITPAERMGILAFRAATESLYCEACTACGLSPI